MMALVLLSSLVILVMDNPIKSFLYNIQLQTKMKLLKNWNKNSEQVNMNNVMKRYNPTIHESSFESFTMFVFQWGIYFAIVIVVGPSLIQQMKIPSSELSIPNLEPPAPAYNSPPDSYGYGPTDYGAPVDDYGAPPEDYGTPEYAYGAPQAPAVDYNIPAPAYSPPLNDYAYEYHEDGYPSELGYGDAP